MQAAGVPAVMDGGKVLYVAAAERGRELEIIAIPLDVGDLLVIHVMPTTLRRRADDQSRGLSGQTRDR